MEIVETIEHTRAFWVHVIFFGTLTIMFLLATVIIPFVAKMKEGGFDFDDIKIMGLLIIAAIVFGTITTELYKQDVSVSYKAEITDFNDVYNNGFEIVDQKGEIYILKNKD